MKPGKVSKPMRGNRARRRTSGLRLIQLWVPDTGSKRFTTECRRQCLLLKGDPAEADTLEFMASASAFTR